MGIRERREAEKAEMKKKIMDAAIDIIETEGYEKLSIRKIAAQIEYSPTTIYLYYKDKAEIIADMSNELYNKIFSSAVTIINEKASLSVEEQTRDIMRVFIKGLCSESEMAKAVMLSGMNVIFANENANCTPTNPAIEMFDNLISNGIYQKIFRPDIQHSSWMIASALLGFVLSSIANQLHLHHDFDQLADNFVNILLNGIKQ